MLEAKGLLLILMREKPLELVNVIDRRVVNDFACEGVYLIRVFLLFKDFLGVADRPPNFPVSFPVELICPDENGSAGL